MIIKQDHERLQIVDYLLSNLYKAYLLIFDKQWQEAFMVIYANVTIVDIFNEFVINAKHRTLLVLLLKKMDQKEKAMKVLDFLKNLVEDTNNNREAILVYE